MDQLLAAVALDGLEAAFGADTRAMVELEAAVGRRTGELGGLAWDCLHVEDILDAAGQPRPALVLVHDMPKVAVRRFHLPIDEAAATIIRVQPHGSANASPTPPPRSWPCSPPRCATPGV